MKYATRTILGLSTALLLLSSTISIAAPPPGKGGGKGNKPVDAYACFQGEIMSNLVLSGDLTDSGVLETLVGQLAGGETITIGGDATEALAALEAGNSILPAGGVTYDAGCAEGNCLVTFAAGSGLTWPVRLDRDPEPAARVPLKMRWVNGADLERHLRMGWVVQAYEDEKYPLDPNDYGTSSNGSLSSAVITFDGDLFRVDGDIVVPGKGKKIKTEQEVFSIYGAQRDVATPWCGIDTVTVECVESTTIETEVDSQSIACP